MRKRTSALLLLLSACAAGPRLPRQPTGERVLEVTGRIRGGPHAVGKGDLAAWPRRTVRGADPHDGDPLPWEGADLSELIGGVQREPGVDTVLVRTHRGAVAAVPLWIVWQFRPVLADRSGGKPLPELVLAWPNAEQPGLARDPRALTWWARGVVALELVEWPVHARALRPPAGATEAVRLGEGPFQARCLACHAVRGVGGTAASALTFAAERLSLAEFEVAVERHAWPASRPDLAPSSEETGRIRAYVEALGRAERAGLPPDEPEGERPPEAREGRP